MDEIEIGLGIEPPVITVEDAGESEEKEPRVFVSTDRTNRRNDNSAAVIAPGQVGR